MDKRGNLFLGAIFAGFFFLIGIMLIPLAQDGVTEARTNIGCSNVTSLSDGAKVVCLTVLDLGVPIFIVAILTFVGGFIGNKL